MLYFFFDLGIQDRYAGGFILNCYIWSKVWEMKKLKLVHHNMQVLHVYYRWTLDYGLYPSHCIPRTNVRTGDTMV